MATKTKAKNLKPGDVYRGGLRKALKVWQGADLPQGDNE